jgi:hypothetical protein
MYNPFDINGEAVTEYEEIANYGRIWRVEFCDWQSVLVIEDPADSPDANYVLAEVDRGNAEE